MPAVGAVPRRVSRRDFLRTGSVSSGLGAALACVFGRTSQANTASSLLERRQVYANRIMIVLELSGGNDGLNTVVPWSDDIYHRLRPTLSFPKKDVLKLNSEVGLHPALVGLKRLWDDGAVAIIQGCGCPNQSRNHHDARTCWRTADSGAPESRSWLGRLAEINNPENTSEYTLSGRSTDHRDAAHEPTRTCGSLIDDGGERRPVTLRARLREIATSIQSGLPSRIFYVESGGFDTHSNQRARHERILFRLGDALSGFLQDLDRMRRSPDVAILVFSEFGRTVKENGGFGTDHGAAGPMFVIGKAVKGGLYGAYPSLTDLDDHGALKMTVDFRRVYATMIEEWMGCQHTQRILKGDFPTLGIFA